MNLLIDRIENPGQRKSAPLVPSVRGAGAPMRRMTSGGEKEKRQQQRQKQVSIDLPTISVNDEPIASGQSAQGRRNSGRKSSLNKNEEKDSHRDRPGSVYHHARHIAAGNDVTSASAGMFSDCMFKSESQRPVRHSPGSTPASSSSSSMYRMDNGYMDSAVEPSGHRHHHHEQKDQLSKLSRKHRCSFANVGRNDNKRLVNEFLRSTQPSTAESRVPKVAAPSPQGYSEAATPKGTHEQGSAIAGYVSGTHGSLQSLLYHDLGYMHLTKGQTPMGPPQPFAPPSVSSSANSSSLSVQHTDQRSTSSSSSPYDSEDSSSNLEKWEVNGSGLTINSGIGLNYNEVNFYRRHIAAELHKFEDTLKHNLKEIIMRNESDMQKNWKAFDVLIAQLEKLKADAKNLHDSVQDTDLVTLRKDFDRSNENSFISTVVVSVSTNATQLKDLETRIDTCKKKLLQQRETLRKLEGLLSLEDSLLNSKTSSKLAYKYRYIVFDVGAFIGVVCVVFFVKWFIWS